MYLTIKPFLVLAVLAISFTIFFLRSKKLIFLMGTVQKKGPAIENIPARLYAVLMDVILQGRVRKKFAVGVAHCLIFWGFIIITVGTIEAMVEGIFHGINLSSISEGLHSSYLFVSELAAVGVLLGVLFGFYRRFVLKPHYLTNGIDAKLILLFTGALMITIFGMNTFRFAAFPTSLLNDSLVVSQIFANILNVQNFTYNSAYFLVEFFWWSHLLIVLGFLIYIPGSKHLHILAAAPNIFFKHLATEKAIEKTDLEDENVESFGLATAKDLSWKSVLDLYACTECGRCEEACPASQTGKPLSPKALVHDMKEALLKEFDNFQNNKFEELKPVISAETKITEDVIWSCTSCRACEENCPVNIEQTNLIFEARKNLVLMEAKFPAEMQNTFKNLENNFTPWAFSNDSRADWCQDLDVKQMADHPNADVLYYVGCAGSYDDRAKKVARSIVKLLKMADVDFAILGKEEKCNGDPARRAGNEYVAQMLMTETAATLNQYKPRKILTACPHCFNTLKNEYPDFDAKYDVVHHSAFLLDLVKEGKIKLNPQKQSEVTLHDSCYLTRWNSIVDQPRELLKNAGVKLKEMERVKQDNLCCGAGGARMFMEENIGTRINHARTDEALKTGAKTIATLCPFCSTMLNDGVKDKGKNTEVEVKDIAEILEAASEA